MRYTELSEDLLSSTLPESITSTEIATRYFNNFCFHKIANNFIILQTGVKLFLHYGDLSDSTNLFHIVSEIKPHEIYNLGAMSHVAVSSFFCID